jgi:micrococcal nuclease
MGIANAWKRTPRPWRPRRRGTFIGMPVLLLAAAIGAAGYYGFAARGGALPHSGKHNIERQYARFAACGSFTRNNCVIDGDTFVLDGEKIRIADIDAPEASGAQCASEAALARRATARLRELLNEGAFELHAYRSRDTDRYGRKLRVVLRDGSSIGDRLIAEGLARRWTGRRLPWCA